MQLVAYGAQDIYLTGNPQITFFKVVYRRHTNFSMEAIEQTLNGTTGFNKTTTSTISRNGDLVHRMYVEFSMTSASTFKLSPNAGSALLKEVELEIGGQLIDKHYGHWMEAYSQLTEPNTEGLSGAPSTSGLRTDGTLFQNMSGMGGIAGQNSDIATSGLEISFIPLQFWFCRNPGLALPLIALQYHEVKVKLTTDTESNVCASTTGGVFGDFKLWCDYIYLDTDERRRFAQVSHEYLIEQVQFQEFGTTTSNELNFNHPVKELVLAGKWDGTASSTSGPSTPVALSAGTTYQLKLNGHDRFSARDVKYFTRTQVWQHHKGHGGVNVADSIGVYSFALKPEEHQPSGTCNFSRIDNATLTTTAQSNGLYVYAVNYNVLRIMSGMGGLAYSN